MNFRRVHSRGRTAKAPPLGAPGLRVKGLKRTRTALLTALRCRVPPRGRGLCGLALGSRVGVRLSAQSSASAIAFPRSRRHWRTLLPALLLPACLPARGILHRIPHGCCCAAADAPLGAFEPPRRRTHAPSVNRHLKPSCKPLAPIPASQPLWLEAAHSSSQCYGIERLEREREPVVP